MFMFLGSLVQVPGHIIAFLFLDFLRISRKMFLYYLKLDTIGFPYIIANLLFINLLTNRRFIV